MEVLSVGNIVAEYVYTDLGCTVRISDAAYAGKSEAELERVRADARRAAWRILEAAARREKLSAAAPTKEAE